jgi:hypothetical protein
MATIEAMAAKDKPKVCNRHAANLTIGRATAATERCRDLVGQCDLAALPSCPLVFGRIGLVVFLIFVDSVA